MTRIVAPTGTRLVYVESRGWLLGKLGIGALVMAGVVLVWGPLVVGRPHAMSLAGWLARAALALVVLGAIVRVAEAVWGTTCTAYVLIHSLGGPGIHRLGRRKGRQLCREALQAPGRSDRDHLDRGLLR